MEQIMKAFESKRNKVYLIKNGDETAVLKIHRTKESASFEAGVLKKLRPCANVPKVLDVRGESLLLEYIGGITALDYFLACGTDKINELAEKMIGFCKTYAEVMKPYAISDTNFRNFIMADDKDSFELYGVDFEDREQGSILKSAANLVAFAFLYDTDIGKKRAFYNTIINEAEADKALLDNEILKCLKGLIDRRGLSVSAEHIVNSIIRY